MSVRSNATAVGAFVLGALVILVGFAVVFGSGALFKDAKRYVIFFTDSLEGLAVGAPVKYRGVQIGSVVEIQALFQMDRGAVDIPVVIELNKDAIQGVENGRETLDTLVEQGLRARLDLASIITGQLFVELNMFPGTKPRRFPNDTDYHQIPSIPSLQTGLQQALGDLIANRPNLARGVDQLLELLNFLTADGGAQELAQGLRSTARLADTLASPDGPLLQSLSQVPGLMAQLQEATAALPGLVEQANQTMKSVGALTDGPEAPLAQTLEELQATLISSRAVGEQVSTLLKQVQAPVAGFAQSGLPQLQGLIQDLDRAVGEISRTVRDLRQNPTRFLLGDPAAEGVRLK